LLDSKNIAVAAHTWEYKATPIEGRTMPYHRGKVVGGTSAINQTAALWARPTDFDAWVKLGNAGWGFADVAPYFQRLEADRAGVGSHHGQSGPIAIARYSDTQLIPIQKHFYEACLAAGFAKVNDHNDLKSPGVGPWPMNRDGETRISTLLSHLNPARVRKNLTIRANCLANRVLLDRGRATGVELADGKIAEADRITLCAGSIGTPAILMRSGIGPKRELEALGIESCLDLAGVGARIWDHAAVPIRLVPHPGECVIGRDPRFQVMARFTAPGSSQLDDMQLVMVTHVDLRAAPALVEEAGVPVVAVLLAALMLPRGHGRLSLQNRDPTVQPRIELNYCSDPEDVRRSMEGVRLAWRVLKCPPMVGAYQRIAGLSDSIVEVHLRKYCDLLPCIGHGSDRSGRRCKCRPGPEMQGARHRKSLCRRCLGFPGHTERSAQSNRYGPRRARCGLVEGYGPTDRAMSSRRMSGCGTNRPTSDVRSWVAIGGRPDIAPAAQFGRE
jgi:choline dehydrogenase